VVRSGAESGCSGLPALSEFDLLAGARQRQGQPGNLVEHDVAVLLVGDQSPAPGWCEHVDDELQFAVGRSDEAVRDARP
jgi:hypothetical protein